VAVILHLRRNASTIYQNTLTTIMKKLLLAALCTGVFSAIQAQNFRFSTRIVATDTITDEGVTFAASSDDAEQENDAIDALFDDDIDAGWEGEPEDLNILTAGLRFQNILVPKGATIDSAYIIVYSHEAKTADDVARLTISAEATDNAETFTEEALITDRQTTDASLLWVVDEEWGLWSEERTPDISNIVQEIVDRDGWAAGNAIAFILAGEDQGPSEVENAREFESFENIADPEDGGDGRNYPERVPELVIFYSAASAFIEVPIIATDTITDEGVTFAASSDDAEQENDAIDALFDDDIDTGWEGEPEDLNILTAGLRFQNLAIPQGAKIDSAYIQVVSHEAKSSDDVARITIVAEATDDAETFTEEALITDRPRTDASLLWVVDEEWGLWSTERTPDISNIVQEIVDRDGWAAGNSIAFILLGEDQGPSEVENAREFESYENIADPEDGGDGRNYPERVPRLFVYFSSDEMVSTRPVFDATVEALTVYPNPANEIATIELASDAAATIRIFDASGRLMQQIAQPSGQYLQLNTNDWSAGIYYIQALQNDQIFLQKLIVE
jgi:DNA-binding IclR family transcriptional regulator